MLASSRRRSGMFWLTISLLSIIACTNPLATQTACALVVVVPDECPEERQVVALDLAQTLTQMTGAQTAVAAAADRPDGPAILLGDEFATDTVRELLTPERIGFDGYVIRSLDEQTLLLCGRREGGHSNAAYGWLRELGCRWFMPGPHGEVIPQIEDLKLSGWELESKPAFIHRSIWYSALNRMRDVAPEDHAALSLELADWQRRNRMGGTPVKFGHSFLHVMPASQYFEAHPEYFPERDGKRVPEGQLCMTNEEVIDIFAQAAITAFDENPDLKSFSLSPNDGYGWCHCARCDALDSEEARGGERGKADRVVTFANAVARKVKAKHPDRLLAFYAYAGCVNPPTYADPDDNVLVVLAHYIFDHMRPITDPKSEANARFVGVVDGWAAVSEQLFVREYYCRWWAPWPMWPAVESDIPYLASRNFNGFNAELECRSEGAEIGWYVLSELCWDPEQDAEALTASCFEGLYGPAADEMLKYFMILREADEDVSLRARGGVDEIPHLFPPDRIDRARQQLDVALGKAATDAQRFQVQRSVDAMELMQAYYELLPANAALGTAQDVATAQEAKVKYERLAAVNERIRQYDLARYWSTATLFESLMDGVRIVLGEIEIDPWLGDFRGDNFAQYTLSVARMTEGEGLKWSGSVDDGYIYGNGSLAAWYVKHTGPMATCLVDVLTYDSNENAGWLEWRISFDRGNTWETVGQIDVDGWKRDRLELTELIAGREDFTLGLFFAPGSNTRARLSDIRITVD